MRNILMIALLTLAVAAPAFAADVTHATSTETTTSAVAPAAKTEHKTVKTHTKHVHKTVSKTH